MNGEELKAYFKTRFGLYKAQVFRLVSQQGGRVQHATNTLKLGGKTLSEIIAMIRSEVKAHEDNHNYPHGETLAKLGGMKRADFDARAQNYFRKDAVPISKFPQITPLGQVTGGILRMPAVEAIYYGRKVTIPAADVSVVAGDTAYIRVTAGGTITQRTLAYSTTTSQTENENTIIIGRLVLLNGVYQVTTWPVVRIGQYAVEQTPRGGAIPATTGSQAAPASLPDSWFQ